MIPVNILDIYIYICTFQHKITVNVTRFYIYRDFVKGGKNETLRTGETQWWMNIILLYLSFKLLTDVHIGLERNE